MDLLFWRHAEASPSTEGDTDMARSLTHRGEKQALRMGRWLDGRLPDGARIFCSPALRTVQTAQALGRKFKTVDDLSPGSSPEDLLSLVKWPHGGGTVLVVGHQPVLGLTIAALMGWQGEELAIRKVSVWWLRKKRTDSSNSTQLLTVQAPEML